MNAHRSMLLAMLASALLTASSVHALEKQARAFTGNEHWRGASSCTLIYYNTCTGWIWIWNGWAPSDRLGVQYDACCANAELGVTFAYTATGAPAGYGFTGTLGVYTANASDCPTGSALASKPWLPQDGWNAHTWNVPVPASFAVMMTMGPSPSSPVSFATEHPAQGPTGPPACGNCYLPTRPNHAFWWGSSGEPLCPGSSFYDGVCDAQLLWDAQMNCPVSVESSTWGQIKTLYR